MQVLKVNSQTDPEFPNILLIIADDIGTDALNGYQNSQVLPETPTIDSLRTAGIKYNNAWSSPTCTPTRANIMSGKYGIKNKVLNAPGNLDTANISLFKAIEDLTNNTYADAVIGKWHISADPVDYNHPSQLGLDHYEGFFSSSIPDYNNWTKVINGVEENVTEYITSHLTDASINWINNQNQPWFLWLAHSTPHSPFHIPPAGTYTQAPTNTNRQKFMAMIENLDFEIDRLLNNIPQNVLENTVIIFIGDNGSPQGVGQNYPAGQYKGTVYQGGIHVPFIVSGKGVTRTNAEEDGLVHVVDIYATILDLVGAELEGGIYNSSSFYDSFSSLSSMREYNYAEIGDIFFSEFAVRNDEYKLIEYSNGVQEFYDLLNDPLETLNIVSSLNTTQEAIKQKLENFGYQVRNGWSCLDGIKNGQEISIDCGGSYCFNCIENEDIYCNEDSVFTCQDIFLDSSIVAKNYIESNHELSGDNARLWASECIELVDGFEFSGNELEIKINDCQDSGIDDLNCPNDNTISQTNIGCCATPTIMSEYSETVSAEVRTIVSNNFPNHDYCYNNNVPMPVNRTFSMDASPILDLNKTSILSEDYRPNYFFGVAVNGVLIAPAPATPFIFTDTNTGEYNWEWVFEPTNMQGSAQGFVKLDCSSAHTGPQGYHYHGNMFQFVEEVIEPGISTTTVAPSEPILIGWAADGFPIVYRFGPDENGIIKLLKSSYQLKYGNRPGNGITAPCGSYNGKYTNDYKYYECSGDLDECNGVQRNITVTTTQGEESFDYFYVITDDFPQIPRCFSGTPDPSFN